MTTLETNSKNLNDKIQAFRELNLSLLKGLRTIHGINEINIIQKSLELSNLHAWNAQIVNEGFEEDKVPKIEGPVVIKPGYSIIEVRDDYEKMSVFVIGKIAELAILMPNLFEILQSMDRELWNNHYDFAEREFELEEHRIETATHALKRAMDALQDALLWCNLFYERTQA